MQTHAGHAAIWSSMVYDASQLCWHLIAHDLVLLDLTSCNAITWLQAGRWQSNAELQNGYLRGLVLKHLTSHDLISCA